MFSIVIAADGRWDLLEKSMNAYDRLHPHMREKLPGLEFIIVTRLSEEEQSKIPVLKRIDVVHRYTAAGVKTTSGWCNPSLAMNEGIRLAKNDYVLISNPESMPLSPVLFQLRGCRGDTIIYAHPYEGLPDGTIGNEYFSSTAGIPSYHIGMYSKKMLYEVNGFDEDFMAAYGWEDIDFFRRLARAGYKHVVKDEIEVLHQWHPRPPWSEIGVAWNLGDALRKKNEAEDIAKPKNGLIKL